MFFIIWGKKTVYRNLGFVADFCPMCREPRAFALRRVGSAGHVYYVSFGEGALVGHERTCSACSTTFAADPAGYAAVSKERLPLPELKRRTFPSLDQVLADRLALEARARANPALLSPDERRALIRGPFLFLSPKVEKRFASTHLDKEIGFALLAAVALLFVGPAAVRRLPPAIEGPALAVLILSALGLVVWQFAVSGRRFMRRQVLPVLAQSLRPLRPTEVELQAVLSELQQHGHKIGKRIRVGELLPLVGRDVGRPGQRLPLPASTNE